MLHWFFWRSLGDALIVGAIFPWWMFLVVLWYGFW
jgi:hypothetical protein